MFIVFIMSLLLVLPPLAVSVYLWTSVARFYDEIKDYEKAVKDLSRKQYATMRLVGNLIANNQHQTIPNTGRTFNTDNKVLNNVTTVPLSATTNGVNNTIVLQDISASNYGKSNDIKNSL